MPTTYRPLAPADADPLARLLEELQAHYAVPCPPHETIVADLLALPPGNRILVGEVDGAIAGFAAIAEIYPGPFLRKGLFLKELYVGAAWRGRGLGRGLMRAIAAIALAEGHGRVDWTADREDSALLRFYDRLGADRVPAKLFYRLTGAALAKVADPDFR
jgi:GNAT superfamily N-acetyltransferase